MTDDWAKQKTSFIPGFHLLSRKEVDKLQVSVQAGTVYLRLSHNHKPTFTHTKMIINNVKTKYYKCYKCHKIVTTSGAQLTHSIISWTDGRILSSDFKHFEFAICGHCEALIEVNRLEYINSITYHYKTDTNSVDITDDIQPDECIYRYSVRKQEEYASELLRYPSYKDFLQHINNCSTENKLYERNVRLQLWRAGNDRRRFMPQWEGGGHYLNYGLVYRGKEKPEEFLEASDIELLRMADENELINAQKLMQLQCEFMRDVGFVKNTHKELVREKSCSGSLPGVFKSWYLVQAELHRQLAEFDKALEYLDILTGSLQGSEPSYYAYLNCESAAQYLKNLCEHGISELATFQP